MPLTSLRTATAPARPVQPPPVSLKKAINSIRLDNIRNSPLPTFNYCHLNVSGKWERKAVGHALSVCYDVFSRQREGVSRRESDAINRMMSWMGPTSEERLGVIVLTDLATAGATHAGVLELLKSYPDDATLIQCRDEQKAAIFRVGVRAGRCPIPPDGTWTYKKKTVKFLDAMKEVDKRVVQCGHKVGGQRLIDGVARAVLSRPLAESIAEKRPRLAPALDSPEAKGVEAFTLIDPQKAAEVEHSVNLCIEMGTPDYMKLGILALLEMPDYVKRGLPLAAAGQAEEGVASN